MSWTIGVQIMVVVVARSVVGALGVGVGAVSKEPAADRSPLPMV